LVEPRGVEPLTS